ncbi:hypothetical protein GCM10023340_04950 [Nocardioides marinquilinus]|uniref:PASTA domain-containing protein n=1 Tax=Nocardioides marinquilinus TaxID=1210400 RepID=A0ABP9P7I7_9ACTN
MTQEQQDADPRAEVLARASRTIDVAPLDVDRVVRTARGRRRTRAVLGAALAVAVVAVGVAVATSGSDDAPSGPATAGAVEPLPEPPPGTKWVGTDGVVVAVPQDWPVVESPCGGNAPAEVVDGTAAASVDCSFGGGQVARVTLAPLDSNPRPSTERTCSDAPTSRCQGGLVFEERGATVVVQTGGPDARTLMDELLDSATVLPDGWTTVPFASFATVPQRVARLETAGFDVRVEGDLGNRESVITHPPVGQPVRTGTTVVVSAAEDDEWDDAAVWRLSGDALPRPGDTEVATTVSRLGCNSGVTGEVLEPDVVYGPTAIIVTFSVVADRGEATCQSNREVPVVVRLVEPIGDRELVDGRCLPGGAAETTTLCARDGRRWP